MNSTGTLAAVAAAVALALAVPSGCESDHDKATRAWGKARDEIGAGDLKAALLDVQRVKDLNAARLESEVVPHLLFPRTLAVLEGHVIIGRTPADDAAALVAAVGDAALSDWWSRRKDVLAAWAKRGKTPRFTVEFVYGEGKPDSSVDDETRRFVVTALALNANAVAFEAVLANPFESAKYAFPYEDEAPLRSLPSSATGELAGRILVRVGDATTRYVGEGDRSGSLTTGQELDFAVKSERKTSWDGGMHVEVKVDAPKEVREGKYGGVSSDTAASKLHELGVLLVRTLRSKPAFEVR